MKSTQTKTTTSAAKAILLLELLICLAFIALLFTENSNEVG